MNILDRWLAALHDLGARLYAPVGRRLERPRLSRRPEARARRARIAGTASLLIAAALPALLWHRAIEVVASDFRIEFGYLVTGWTGYALIVLGLLAFVPVILSIGRRPESRLYARAWRAYLAWGLSLYLLGCLLAVQVAQIARNYTA